MTVFRKFSEQQFLLDKLKGQFCLTEAGEVYKFLGHVESKMHSEEITEKNFFGQSTTRVAVIPAKITSVQTLWSKHINTADHATLDLSGHDSVGINRVIDLHTNSRNRYLLMVADLAKFEFSVAPQSEEDKVKKEIGL
jgi:hypothetical protein